MGIAGEPSTPADPAHGLVWSSMIELIDRSGADSKYISIADTPRKVFAKHPWSIGGGGAAELKETLDENAEGSLKDVIEVAGVLGMTNADDVMLAPVSAFMRKGVENKIVRPLALGDEVRDWLIQSGSSVAFPYEDESLVTIDRQPGLRRWLWPYRTVLGNRATFGQSTYFAEGRPWWEWHQLSMERLRTPLTIVFGEVASHNHFVLDRGGKVFKQTAPLIKLPPGASENDYLGLLGLLNSSTACFWLKQCCFPKGGDHVGDEGARVRRSLWDERYAFNSGNVEALPLPAARPLTLAQELDRLGRALFELLPGAICSRGVPDAETLKSARQKATVVRARMIALQEELDWQCYRLYGLSDDLLLELPSKGWEAVVAAKPTFARKDLLTLFNPDDEGSSHTPANLKSHAAESAAKANSSLVGGSPSGEAFASIPTIDLGQRAFEIALARQMRSGDVETTWFTRDGVKPITRIPEHWPAEYQDLVRRRINRIASDRAISLIEKPEFKRRWNAESWDDMQERALREWLLDRLETQRYRRGTKENPELSTTAQISDVAAADADFIQVATIYRGRADFDLAALVAELVQAEAVPFLPVLRYKDTGLRKRALWERTWDLQRQEDAGKDVGQMDVPPKYVSGDFRSTDCWRLRGKLDVPKERWVSFPHCSTEGDQSLLVAWAGWNHLEQATALAAYYDARKREGWDARRLTPLLGGLLELLPWIHQWHPELDPEFGETAGQSFQHMLEADAHELGLTLDDIRNWTPPEKIKVVRRKKERA